MTFWSLHFYAEGTKRLLQRHLSVNFLQADTEGKNGNRVTSWKPVAGAKVNRMGGCGPGGSRDEGEWVGL